MDINTNEYRKINSYANAVGAEGLMTWCLMILMNCWLIKFSEDEIFNFASTQTADATERNDNEKPVKLNAN